MAEDQTATYTFLFTDIQGSTRRWEENADAMSGAVARHDELLRRHIEAHDGEVFKTVGDAFCAAFLSAPGALAAALNIQRAVGTQDWGQVAPLEVRVALHSGTAQCRDNDYFGPTVNRVARILGVCHGGQTLLSGAVRQLVCDVLPAETELVDRGDHRLKDLDRAEHLYQLCAPDLRREFPPLKSLNQQAHNLPVHPTPLIGREREVGEVSRLLEEPQVRLVTLLGPGGTGKTRLSLQVATELMENFPDGVRFVPLAPVSDIAFVLPAIAEAVGVAEKTGESLMESLCQHLGDKKMLLVLDNCEQIVEASPLFAELLTACARVKLLASSRVVLHVRGEREYPVAPLGLPRAGERPSVGTLAKFPAVELFCQRAQSVKPGFELTPENAASVVEICLRLDGLPLAIELAAARIKLLTPQAMLGHLRQRFKLLTGGARDLPERHQTLRNTIDWSFDLLEPTEQALFQQLCVFAGGCTLQAAMQVCAIHEMMELDFVEALASLIDKSLLRHDEEGAQPRFAMLETIREYGLGRLQDTPESPPLHQRHAQYYLDLARSLSEELRRNPPAGSGSYAPDFDNFRTALNWWLEQEEADRAAEFAASLSLFWERRGHFSEACEYLERALARGERIGRRGLVAKLHGLLGWFHYLRDDYAKAQSFEERSLEISAEICDRSGTADALNELGLIAKAQGRVDEAKALFTRSLEVVRELGDTGKQAQRLSNLGLLSIETGGFEEARNYLQEAGSLYQSDRDSLGTAGCLCNLAELGLQTHDWESARACSREGLELFRELDDQRGVAYCLANLTEAALGLADFAAVPPLVREALSIAWESEMRWLIPQLMECAATARWESADAPGAVALLAAAGYFRDQFGMERSPTEQERVSVWEGKWGATLEADLRRAREQLDLQDGASVVARTIEELETA